MLLPIVSCFLILSATLSHYSLAAPAHSTNASAGLTIPSTPGFSLEGKFLFPRQPMFDASAMLLLTCQMLYDYSQPPWSAAAKDTERVGNNICIVIARTYERVEPHLLFQNRHAMWGLWLAAVRQAIQGNTQPGVFTLVVSSMSVLREEVAIITYKRDPDFHSLAATPNNRPVDVISRSNVPHDISYTDSSPRTSPENKTAISSTGQSTVSAAPYTVILNQVSARKLVMVDVFNTICETMIQRASMPDRTSLTGEWFYTCKATGYKLGLRPPEGASGSPPYAAIMGGLANLLKAMNEAKQDKEIAFNVQSQSGEVLLQGLLIDVRAGEAASGISFA